MSPPQSPTFASYRSFVERFVSGSGRQALDGFDLPALRALSASDKQAALDLLLAELDSVRNDPRIPAALMALDPAKARPALQRCLAGSSDDTALAAAAVLLQPPADPQTIAELLRLLQSSYIAKVRAQSIELLAEVADPAIPPALIAALADEEKDVRSSACRALVARSGLAYLPGQDGRFGLLVAKLLSTLPSVRSPAVAELGEVFRQLFAGHSAASLGMLSTPAAPESPLFQRLRRSVFGEPGSRSASAAPIDLEALAGLHGEELGWGQQFILQLVSDGDDRGIAAAASLHTDWSLAALNDLAADEDADGAETAQAALGKLASA